MSDTVTLTLPRHPQYYSVARMVIGGLGAGLALSYDELDDVQQAIGTLLDTEELAVEGDFQLQIEVSDHQLSARLGCFSGDKLSSALVHQTSSEGEVLDLRKVLDTIVDSVEISDSDGGQWVTLTKRAASTV